jgi:hypothetical protein
MDDRARSLQQILDELVPEAEIETLAREIGSCLPAAAFRLQIRNIIAFTFTLALSNPHPWREQKRGFKRVADAANETAIALRKLDKVLNDDRWLLSRQEVIDNAELTGIDLSGLAACLDNLALPAEEMAKVKKKIVVPRHEGFSMMVQLAARTFIETTGSRPTITYHPVDDCYVGKFIYLVEFLWAKIFGVAESVGLSPIDGPQGNSAIGKAVQRTLRRMDTAKEKPSRSRP